MVTQSQVDDAAEHLAGTLNCLLDSVDPDELLSGTDLSSNQEAGYKYDDGFNGSAPVRRPRYRTTHDS